MSFGTGLHRKIAQAEASRARREAPKYPPLGYPAARRCFSADWVIAGFLSGFALGLTIAAVAIHLMVGAP